jgi:hypothetical protein
MRMRAQGLWRAGVDAPEDAVTWLTAVQAQEHWYARWSVGQRTRRADGDTVDRAFDEGRILRTHVLRPTWHYVAATDLRWLMRLSGPLVSARHARRHGELGLDAKLLTRTNDLIAAAVARRHLTRREIGAMLDRNRIPSDEHRLAYIVMHAELTAVVCSGAMRGKQHTYAPFDERVSRRAGPEGDAALAELARRFFTTRSPATLRDFAWWSGLPMATARRGLELVAPELEQRQVDGRDYWLAGRGGRAPSGPRVDLVQCYDEVIISYRESRDVLQSPRVDFPVPSSLGGFVHVLLLDGRLLGHWRVARRGNGATIETRVRPRLRSDERAALEGAVERFERFVAAGH